MITLTVGRVVWYRPNSSDGDLADHSYGRKAEPLAAIVAHVFGDTRVNLLVIDSNGHTHPRSSVFLFQGDGEPPIESYAEWMPYQKGQAAKTEQLEKAAVGQEQPPA